MTTVGLLDKGNPTEAGSVGENDLRIPLVIGVTGHRDLRPENIAKLEERVAEIFTDLRRDYPNTPWIVLSPLAEGADRLVARVARRFFTDADRLVVPMPMPPDAYAVDFDEPDSIAEFEALGGDARQIDVWADMLPAPDFSQRADRNRCYTAAGAFIVRHCQILIALWSGRDSGSPCGTARMVEYRRQGLPSQFRAPDSPFGLDELGPVYLIATPRRSSPELPVGALDRYVVKPPLRWDEHSLPDESWRTVQTRWVTHQIQSPLKGKRPVHHALLSVALAVERGVEYWATRLDRRRQPHPGKLSPDEIGSARYQLNLKNLDRFNKRALASTGLKEAMEKSKDELIGIAASDKGTTHRTLLGQATRFFLERYALADMLAKQFQGRQRRTLLVLCTLVVVAGGLFHWNAHMTRTPFLLLGYLLTLGAAFCLFVVAKRSKIHQQYLDYRAIAEGMRVGFIWELVGLPDCVADHYLQQQRSELDWIRIALRNWQFAAQCSGIDTSSELPAREHYEMAGACWVDDQAIYHSKSARHRSDIRKLFEFGVFSLFLAATALAITVGAREAAPSHRHADSIADCLIVSIGFVMAVAGAMAAFAEKMGIAAESRHFARMVNLFMHASHQLAAYDKDNDHAKMDALLLAIGKEALDENALWVILHRERPHEVPIG